MENNHVEEITMEEITMEDAMKDIDKSMKRLRTGDIIKGKVMRLSEDEVLVNIGYMSDGIITKEELSDDGIDTKDILKPGDEIDLYILQMDDGEGNVLLSKKMADQIVVWDELEEYYALGKAFDVSIKEVVKGGVTASIKGVRAFIPASQLSLNYVEDLNKYVGQTLKVKLIEFDRESKKVILSRKEIEQRERDKKKKELWNTLKKGEKRKGVVTRLAKFGAFVDLGGADGLIHLSDLSWKRVLDPGEVVSVGDKVEVYVIDFDEKRNRISLGLKDIQEDPWNDLIRKYKLNDTVEGKVVRITNFGAFIEIEPGLEGLVHISQVTDRHIANVSEVLSVGDKIKVKIIELKPEERKLSLSAREAIEGHNEDYSKYNDTDNGEVTIGDVLKDKLKGLKF